MKTLIWPARGHYSIVRTMDRLPEESGVYDADTRPSSTPRLLIPHDPHLTSAPHNPLRAATITSREALRRYTARIQDLLNRIQDA